MVYFEFSVLSQNIPISGEEANWDITKAFIRILRLLKGKSLQSLESAFSFFPALHKIDCICFLNRKSRSMKFPSSFTA